MNGSCESGSLDYNAVQFAQTGLSCEAPLKLNTLVSELVEKPSYVSIAKHELPVVACEPKEGPNICYVSGHGPLGYSLDLAGISANSLT